MKPLAATVLICIFLIITFLSGCSSNETPSEAVPTGDGIIVCEVFYRPGTGAQMETAPLINFSKGNDQETHLFATMSFEARFQDDDYEGRSLSISVTNLENGDEISRQLYQFDAQNPVENQFIGGHGFTGLNYIFQPNSSAEIQYYCSVR